MECIKDSIEEGKKLMKWIEGASEVAGKALCLDSKCGSVIVKDDEIIGAGYNAPPLDDLNNRICLNRPDSPLKPRFDKTCCVHAEWRAIMDALRRNADKIKGSRLYFSRVNDAGEIQKSGKPYCTVCSRLALDSGIAEFVLYTEEGFCIYPTDEYNKLSYDYYR